METPDGKPRHSVGALALLVIDLVVAICAFVQVGVVVRVFWEMIRDFGVRLPGPTRVLLGVSNSLTRHYGLGFGLIVCFVLWLIIWMYLRYHRRGDRKRLFVCLWTVMLCLVALIMVTTIIMFLPIFTLGQEVGAPRAVVDCSSNSTQ